jgi:hypothetical protein
MGNLDLLKLACFVHLSPDNIPFACFTPPWLYNNTVGQPLSRLPFAAVGKSDPNKSGSHHGSIVPDQTTCGLSADGVRSQSHTPICPSLSFDCYLCKPASPTHLPHHIPSFRTIVTFLFISQFSATTPTHTCLVRRQKAFRTLFNAPLLMPP